MYNVPCKTMAKRKETPVTDFVTTREAGELLGITSRHINRLIDAGVLDAVKVTNRLTLVNRASLANWTPKRKRRERPIE